MGATGSCRRTLRPTPSARPEAERRCCADGGEHAQRALVDHLPLVPAALDARGADATATHAEMDAVPLRKLRAVDPLVLVPVVEHGNDGERGRADAHEKQHPPRHTPYRPLRERCGAGSHLPPITSASCGA